MQTMNISLPDPLKQCVEEQVSGGGYSSASEYLRELIRADQKLKAREQLEKSMLEALSSDDPIDITPQMWEGLRHKIRARAEARNSKTS